jgi:WD40 repeat protein
LELLSAGGNLATASLKATGGVGFCAVGSDGSIFQTSSLVTWKLERVLGGESSNSPFVDRVSAVRFSPDSKMLAVGSGEPSRSGDILLWEIESGKLLETWKDRHEDTVLSLDFSPDGKWLASGGADKLARVTDVSTGKQIYLLEAHTHHVMGVAFRADTRVLATSGGDGVVNTWDLLSGERLKKIIGWNKEVTALQFLGSSQKIVTSSAENLVRIVSDDGTEVRAIARLPDFMQSAASASSGALIIGGGEDSALRLWDGASGTELAVFASP